MAWIFLYILKNVVDNQQGGRLVFCSWTTSTMHMWKIANGPIKMFQLIQTQNEAWWHFIGNDVPGSGVILEVFARDLDIGTTLGVRHCPKCFWEFTNLRNFENSYK